MTDNEIVKALEICINNGPECSGCPYERIQGRHKLCADNLVEDALALINRQKAKIEELNEKLEAREYKLECLLCHATGNQLSKCTYSLKTMEYAVNDYIEECCEEAEAEAIREFAEKLKDAPIVCDIPLFGLSTKNEIIDYFNNIMLQVRDAIDSLVEEMAGGE